MLCGCGTGGGGNKSEGGGGCCSFGGSWDGFGGGDGLAGLGWLCGCFGTSVSVF